MINLMLGDCLERMRSLPDDSVDAVVTDPPYGLSFMGKKWDYDVPSVEVWAECLRVLKPGGHLLAFAGTRTQHRMAVRIEDAGFEIRDLIAWVYATGFPKSLDVSKAIDKRGGAADLTPQIGDAIKAAREARAMTVAECDRLFCDGTTNWSWFEGRPKGQRAPTVETFARIVAAWPELSHLAEAVAEVDREALSAKAGTRLVVAPGQGEDRGATELQVTAPATDAARQWSGWGTSLKPALEPITVARKPLVGTVAQNVLTHGTGAINVDGCRVAGEPSGLKPYTRAVDQRESQAANHRNVTFTDHPDGRWPANLIHDGSDEVTGLFPQSDSARSNGNPNNPKRGTNHIATSYGQGDGKTTCDYRDTGSAARFFYCAKASKSDRGDGNSHPTVKPTDLMRYLCRLVTPPGGVVLDPFMGSGTTGKAAQREGFRFIGIERDPGYFEIARKRIEAA